MSLVLVKWLHSNLKLNENKCVLRCRDVCNLYCTKPYAHLHCLVARYYISHTCYCIFMNGKCQWRTWQFLTIIFRSFNNGSDLEKGTTITLMQFLLKHDGRNGCWLSVWLVFRVSLTFIDLFIYVAKRILHDLTDHVKKNVLLLWPSLLLFVIKGA